LNRLSSSTSITLRLTLLFAVVAALTFASVGAYLYGALAGSMAHNDDLEILTRVRLMRQFLSTAPSAEALRMAPHPLIDAVFLNEGCVLRVAGLDGRLLLQTSVPSHPLPAMAPISVATAPKVTDLVDWGIGRSVQVEARLGDGTPVIATIARERSDRAAMLQRYTRNLTAAIAAGALLVAFLGYLAVRHAIGSLRAVIGKANDISTHCLQTRLAIDSMPSEVRELSAAFNGMLDRLEDGVQRLSGFAADLAHDLRTPINTLMVQTQVALSRPRQPEDYRALLASSIEEYQRLARMIENTLFLARADNAQLAVHREMLDAEAELQRIRDYFEGVAEEAGIILDVSAKNVRVHADPILFRRAVNNLVSNAIRYTPRGGVVRLSAGQPGGDVEVVVENTGPGIAVEHMPHIFDRYYRGDPARPAAGHSVGLGLSIVQAIMRLHSGEIDADSTPGVRTRFCMRFGTA
jgi:two-component system heavy metal sensor histidine kinase CusS